MVKRARQLGAARGLGLKVAGRCGEGAVVLDVAEAAVRVQTAAGTPCSARDRVELRRNRMPEGAVLALQPEHMVVVGGVWCSGVWYVVVRSCRRQSGVGISGAAEQERDQG